MPGFKLNTEALFSSASEEWGTPQDLFDRLHAIHGFTLDVCASHANHKTPQYMTKDIDGLKQPWADCVCWMNPPYGRGIGAWMRKARLEVEEGGARKVVCLVPVRTDTAWWQENVENEDGDQFADEITFLRGRLRFTGAGDNGNSAPFPSAIVVYER